MKLLAPTLLILAATLIHGCSRGTPVAEINAPEDAGDELETFVADLQDWASWRGPHGNNTASTPAAPVKWSEAENVVWSSPIPGRGHASPIVVGDQVMLATASEESEQQLVVSFDRTTGEENWRRVIHEGAFTPQRKMHAKSTHANGTICCDDQHLFVAFLNGAKIIASAVDFSGEIVWQQELGAFESRFGYAPSPTLYKSFVLFAADNKGGGYLAALHRRTGDIVWRKARGQFDSYSSPIVATINGKDQLLISGDRQVNSYDPTSGELNWSAPGTAKATCGTPVWNDELVFASGGYPERQTLAVRADGSGDVVWSNSTKVYEPSLLLVDDALYAVTDDGIAYCWDAATGKTHWKKRLGGAFSSSPLCCDGRIYVSNLSGVTHVFEASTDGLRLIAKNQLGSDAYATPTICDGRIYLRVGVRQGDGRQEMLYCVGKDALEIGTL
ncbi:MAG: PQQ-binding-like beta-propeller repeat protein [Planctomycetota bacterium]